ncbi:MAG: 16S rRNA (cytosine(1402)-N(4))-methyltransferase RsmH [Nitrospirae bacterium]|nr:MAG: 16S rRNA (cytosine(1402)-N(4))-methyltransferase RsmH [Nitrospirota bacterium]
MDQAHTPVLLQEILFWLNPRPGGQYVDCTLGTGGIAQRVLETSAPTGWLLGIDRDPQAVAFAKQRLSGFGERVQCVCGNFCDLKAILHSAGVERVDGIVFDLGVSSMQLADPARGFSFLHDGPLDMRMDPTTMSVTAADLVNTLPQRELARLIGTYGEERYASRIARAIVRARTLSPFRTTAQLVSAIVQAVPSSYRHGRRHCATRTFQALRIAVNHELEILEGALRDAVSLLKAGGRICVLSFHSLEDRIVKRTFAALSKETPRQLTLLTKKPWTPSLAEQQANPRSRSAKLRVGERIASDEQGVQVVGS